MLSLVTLLQLRLLCSGALQLHPPKADTWHFFLAASCTSCDLSVFAAAQNMHWPTPEPSFCKADCPPVSVAYSMLAGPQEDSSPFSSNQVSGLCYHAPCLDPGCNGKASTGITITIAACTPDAQELSFCFSNAPRSTPHICVCCAQLCGRAITTGLIASDVYIVYCEVGAHLIFG